MKGESFMSKLVRVQGGRQGEKSHSSRKKDTTDWKPINRAAKRAILAQAKKRKTA